MTTLKTNLNERPATDTPFTPTATIPKSNVQEAIEYAAANATAAWGGITGTLSAQTDLQSALDAKLDDSQASVFGLTLLDDVDAATAQTTLGLVIGTNVQAYDADLTSWAGVTRASGFDTFAATPSLANLGSLLTDDPTGLIAWMTTPSSANLASLVTDETGTGALMFGTSPSITTDIRPASHDGASLGTAALGFSDLFLGTGAVITWGAASTPDVTITHSSNLLEFGGAASGYRFIDGPIIAGTAAVASARLQVNGTDFNSSSLSFSRFSADVQPPYFTFYKSRGATVGANTVVASGDSVGIIEFYAADGTDYIKAAQITAGVDGTPGTNDMPGRLVFSTTADGAATPTERMRITSDGNVRPGSNDGGSLGISGTAWSDLFLASGSVINFAGDVTITHSSDTLTIDGGNYIFSNNGNANNFQIVQCTNTSTGNAAVAGFAINAGTARAEMFLRGSGHSSVPGGWYINNTVNAPIYFGVDSAFIKFTKTDFSPDSTNTHSLGTTTQGWADLFLASGGVISFASGGDVTITHSTGLLTFSADSYVFGAPTGGAKGAGTINAVAVYDDNVLLTCYVLEQAIHGQIDLGFWDAASRKGAHEPAHRLAANPDELDPENYSNKWRALGHLPNMPSREQWAEGSISTGDLAQRLWETVEIQAVHIAKLNERLKTLEGLH